MRDIIDRLTYTRHTSPELITEKYLRDLILTLNQVFFKDF